MKILRASGKSVIVILIPIIIGLLGNIISPDWTEKIKTICPNYLSWLSASLAILAVIVFIWGIREEIRNEKNQRVREGGIYIFQSGKKIGKEAKVTGMQTNSKVSSASVKQEFDMVEGELTGLKVKDSNHKK